MHFLPAQLLTTLTDVWQIKQLYPNQTKAWHAFHDKQNLIIVDRTGTGKTLAYLLPMLSNINYQVHAIQAIIIIPTKELLNQTMAVLQTFKKNLPALKVVNYHQLQSKSATLVKNIQAHIVVCLPHAFLTISQAKNQLPHWQYLVIDEADMCLDLGFFKEINTACNQFGKRLKPVQKIAVSASLFENLTNQIKKFFQNSVVIGKTKNIWLHPNITHHLIKFEEYAKDAKWELLSYLLTNLNPYLAIIFCNDKKTVDELFLKAKLIIPSILKLHGGMSLRERKNVVKTIKNSAVTWLIATDLAARGIDLVGVSHVVNYQMPKEDLWYLHRSGRSGRKNQLGNSYVFQEANSYKQILRLQSKGIVWHGHKFTNGSLVAQNLHLPKQLKKKITPVDLAIRKLLAQNKTFKKPNSQKKVKLAIQKIKQQAKRERIEAQMNAARIKKYKIINSLKNRHETQN